MVQAVGLAEIPFPMLEIVTPGLITTAFVYDDVLRYIPTVELEAIVVIVPLQTAPHSGTAEAGRLIDSIVTWMCAIRVHQSNINGYCPGRRLDGRP
jgi:hypothetical protein